METWQRYGARAVDMVLHRPLDTSFSFPMRHLLAPSSVFALGCLALPLAPAKLREAAVQSSNLVRSGLVGCRPVTSKAMTSSGMDLTMPQNSLKLIFPLRSQPIVWNSRSTGSSFPSRKVRSSISIEEGPWSQGRGLCMGCTNLRHSGDCSMTCTSSRSRSPLPSVSKESKHSRSLSSRLPSARVDNPQTNSRVSNNPVPDASRLRNKPSPLMWSERPSL
mmetsp:Transcript_55297/g.98414  ORF Transcript_55297/g.98414 Transcript_55297/m.98414 type:complete len:220 (+) Transcript_55297:999-1658(+)